MNLVLNSRNPAAGLVQVPPLSGWIRAGVTSKEDCLAECAGFAGAGSPCAAVEIDLDHENLGCRLLGAADGIRAGACDVSDSVGCYIRDVEGRNAPTPAPESVPTPANRSRGRAFGILISWEVFRDTDLVIGISGALIS